MGDVKNLPYRIPPALVPVELAQAAPTCPNCGTPSPIDWSGTQEYPQQPIPGGLGDGHWVPSSISIQCHGTCQEMFKIDTPRNKVDSIWTVYGDEAARFIQNPSKDVSDDPLHFFCITLVGLHNRRRGRVFQQLRKIKRALRPSEEPDSWEHHFTEIWGADPSDEKFNVNNKNDKVAHGKALAKLIRNARPEMATMNVSSCIRLSSDKKVRAKQIKEQKQEMFAISLLTSLEQFRRRNLGIRWVYDNVKDASKGPRTEGWASEVFLGMQYTRLFTWLSASATVLEPAFVKPGTHPLLEIADFVSYSVARDFERAATGHTNEIPSTLIGQGFYQGVLRNGNIDAQWAVGLPLQKFFGFSGKV